MGWRSGRSLGLAFVGEGAAAHAAERARAAEAAGIDSLWFIEDYFQTGAFAMAGAAAAVTSRVELGLGVVNPYSRHPALLTMETATLAAIAPGRVTLGLGTGVRHWIEGQMRIPTPRPLAALSECVEVVRRLWAGERVSHAGDSFGLADVALEYKPAQAELPIVLGVKGPRALALAGAVADGVVCSIMSSPAHVRRARASAAAAREGTSRGPCPVLAYVPVAIGPDPVAARRAVRPLLARYLAHLHGQTILSESGAVTPEQTLAIRQARARGESGAALVTEDHVDAFALAGTPEHARRRLDAWIEAGLDVAIALPAGEADPSEQIARIGAELGSWLARRP